MNYEDIDIEKLAREYADKTTTPPPPSAWQKIQSNLTATTLAATQKKKLPAWMWALAGAFVASAMMLWQATRIEADKTMAAVAQPAQNTIANTVVTAKTQRTTEEPCTTVHTSEIPSSKSFQPTKKNPATTNASQPSAATAVYTVAAPQPSSAKHLVPANGEPTTPATLQAPQHTETQPSAPTTNTPQEEPPTLTSEATTVPKSLDDTPLQEEKNNLFIPNLITPNGDGINDYWIIPTLQDHEDVQVAIFTAQGKRIYSNNHYHGEFSGSDLEEGTYYYQVVVKSAQIQRRGVLVIRR